MIHIPIWMMNNLCLEEGSDVVIRNIGLNKGSFVKIRPHKTAFIKLNNGDPKAILEEELTNYATLNKGDKINILIFIELLELLIPIGATEVLLALKLYKTLLMFSMQELTMPLTY